jgi:sulfur carrier protein ThiS
MSATICPYGMLKDYIDGEKERAVEAGHTVREIMVSWNMPPEIVAMVLINGELQTKDTILQDGDVVKLMAVIGGG